MHALNWRIKASENVADHNTLSYTDICSLSLDDEHKLKEHIIEFIKTFRKTTLPSKAEAVYCLNLDFFRVL